MRVPSTRCLVDIRRADGEFVVTADLPGIGGDDLSVGLHPRRGQLVIGARDSVLERVDLPWESASATKARFNNGVLEVRLRPSDAATSGP